MSLYVLRFTGQGDKPAGDVERIRNTPDVKIVDDTSPRMLLVETANPVPLQTMMQQDLTNWLMTPQRLVPLPPPHKHTPRNRAGGQDNGPAI